MNPKVSVIIPVYNEENSIGKCLESLSRQTYKPLEIIAVDDGSKDSSKLKVQSARRQTTGNVGQAKSKIKNLKLLEQKHLGTAAARNLGAGEARGSILVFVDADMIFNSDFIEKLVAPIIQGKTKGTFTKEEYVGNWKNVWARCWNINEGLSSGKRIPINYPDRAPVFRAILKSEFEKAGGFEDIGYTDDWTLSRKLGYQANLSSGAVCYHFNPENLREVFKQARWIGGNEFLRRKLKSLIKYNPAVSFLTGFAKSIFYKEPLFLIFKIVYDLGILLTVIQSFVGISKTRSSLK